jgi:hypothetical protein
MQSANNSNASSGEPEIPSGHIMGAPTTGFTITPQDANILKGYMSDFELADTPTRSNILEKAMGELYRLRPANPVFDKKEAKQAHIYIYVLAR